RINQRIWGQTRRDPEVSDRIQEIASYLKGTLYEFVAKFNLDILIAENALTIPMNLPLGVALTQFLAETQMPCIAHHHDFSWERIRFSINAVTDYLDFAFPPRLPNIIHTVINQAAQEQLCWRRGVSSILTPNVIDYKNPPPHADDYAADVRGELGLAPDDLFFLQPTRIVPRKGIEHAIKLLEMLGDSRCKLVISHAAGDEGFEYVNMLQELAHESNVDMRIVSDRVADLRGTTPDGKKIYTLWDLYPHADFVTYPSLYEGFGNALLEAIYFKKPVLINRYDIYARDIEPRGFHFPMMEGYVRRSLVKQVQELLDNPKLCAAQCEHNYHTARKFFSYEVLRRKLNAIIANLVVE
ncbi:MAG: glycosyltransferase family 4 protein, partial [Kiritimatiellae bacterium]|nr:glycosyltransferase family 4 protein [Kiritimatiellia bacterium]